MQFIFPLLTVRNKRLYSFRDLFWEILEKDAETVFVISPFIDSKIFERIFKATLSNKSAKKLILISRPPDNKMRKKDFQLILESLSRNRMRFRLGTDNSVFWYFDPHLHAKVLISDYNEMLFGSQNITHNGLGDDLQRSRCNNELGAYVKEMEGETKAQVKDFVDYIISESKLIYPYE